MQQTFLGSKIEGSGVLGKAMISSGPRKCGCEKKKERPLRGWRDPCRNSLSISNSDTQLSEDWIVCNCSFRFIGERRGVCVCGFGGWERYGNGYDGRLAGAKGQRGKQVWVGGISSGCTCMIVREDFS